MSYESYLSSTFNCALNAMGTFLGGCTTVCTFSSLPDDTHLQKHLDILRITSSLRGVIDSCLTSRMFSLLQFRSSMCCRDLFLMSDMQSSLITTNSVSYEIPFLWFVTFRCIIPRGFLVDLLCIFKV